MTFFHSIPEYLQKIILDMALPTNRKVGFDIILEIFRETQQIMLSLRDRLLTLNDFK